MTSITIVGGVYLEYCEWPSWDMVWGSGGRAAAAVAGSQIDDVRLISYLDNDTKARFAPFADLYGFKLETIERDCPISFDYVHPLSVPVIRPTFGTIPANPPIEITSDIVLRFGMLEGTGIINADTCVYDPQSAFGAEPFDRNGSTAKRLAIVANSSEIQAMCQSATALAGARDLIANSIADVVVVKSGIDGAFVVTERGTDNIPAFGAQNIFKIGSGDVFAASFAAFWAVHDMDPVQAGRLASIAVSDYVESRELPIRSSEDLARSKKLPLKACRDQVYLAGPFFTMAQRWLINEARRSLRGAGLTVLSPFHDIGHGPAEFVGPADVAALKKSDAVFAILDGLDSGTVFEIGFARAIGKSVYVFSQNVAEEDLKMVVGTGCNVFDDFVTAIFAVATRS